MHVCEICGYENPFLNDLKDHIISVHKSKEATKLFCDKCDFSTPTRRTLLQHIRRKHDPEKQKKCPHCDYKTAVNTMLQIHIDRYHTDVGGEAIHVCDVCSSTFIFENSMKYHKFHKCEKFLGDKSHPRSIFKKKKA